MSSIKSKGNKVFPPYKTSFLELVTYFFPNINKTPSRVAPSWSFGAEHLWIGVELCQTRYFAQMKEVVI
jgi:hypothetical protein